MSSTQVMGQIRKRYSPAFKAKVVLELLKETRSVSELSAEYGVHSSQLHRWRKEAVKNLPQVFAQQTNCVPGRGRAAHPPRAGEAGNEPIFDVPKSKNGVREVLIDGPILRVLAEHQAKQEVLKSMEGERYKDRGLVFTLINGNPVDESKLNSRVFARLMKKAGVPRCRIHDLRHLHATILAGANVNPKVIQNRLGHSTFAFTMQRYVHKNRGEQRGALEAYRAFVSKATQEKDRS